MSILSCKFINEAIPQFSNKLVFNVERDERSDEEKMKVEKKNRAGTRKRVPLTLNWYRWPITVF